MGAKELVSTQEWLLVSDPKSPQLSSIMPTTDGQFLYSKE